MTTSTTNKDVCAIAHNGPLTTFSLTTGDGREWHLCRDDLPQLARGDFVFDDGRSNIDLEGDEKDQIVRQAKDLIEQIEQGRFFADIGQGYARHFKNHEGAYGALVDADLGRCFVCENRPFVFLGANRRARTYKVVGQCLLDGQIWKFTVAYMERALGKERVSPE